MAPDDVEHGGELVTTHRALFPVGEIDENLIKGPGLPVVDESGDGHRLAGEHRLITDSPFP